MVPPSIPQVGANPEYARILEIWQPMSGILALLVQNIQIITILRCRNHQNSSIFGADTYFGYLGGYQIIILLWFFRGLVLLEVFNLFKFLGRKEQITLQCAHDLNHGQTDSIGHPASFFFDTIEQVFRGSVHLDCDYIIYGSNYYSALRK